MNKTWTDEEVNFLKNKWFNTPRKYIAGELRKSVVSVTNKAYSLGLGKSWEFHERLSLSYIFRSVFGYKPSVRLINSKLIARGCPYNKAKTGAGIIKSVKLELFWKWLKQHKDEFSFLKFERYSLGAEPEWVDKKRKADWAAYNKERWNTSEKTNMQ